MRHESHHAQLHYHIHQLHKILYENIKICHFIGYIYRISKDIEGQSDYSRQRLERKNDTSKSNIMILLFRININLNFYF